MKATFWVEFLRLYVLSRFLKAPQHKFPLQKPNAVKVFICLSDQKDCDPPEHTGSIVLWREVFQFFSQTKRDDIIGHT